MKKFIVLALIATPAWANENNSVMKDCVQNNSNYVNAAACYFEWKNEKIREERAELRDFLKHNPRYRHPGQSLNRCWGKPREMPFESVNASANADGSWYVGINYKDKIPAGCFENGPWDNRDKK